TPTLNVPMSSRQSAETGVARHATAAQNAQPAIRAAIGMRPPRTSSDLPMSMANPMSAPIRPATGASTYPMSRAFLFVLDSFGIGGAEDATRFGDEGSNTFGHIAERCAAGMGDREDLRHGPLHLPNMMKLGLGRAAAAAGYGGI